VLVVVAHERLAVGVVHQARPLGARVVEHRVARARIERRLGGRWTTTAAGLDVVGLEHRAAGIEGHLGHRHRGDRVGAGQRGARPAHRRHRAAGLARDRAVAVSVERELLEADAEVAVAERLVRQRDVERQGHVVDGVERDAGGARREGVADLALEMVGHHGCPPPGRQENVIWKGCARVCASRTSIAWAAIVRVAVTPSTVCASGGTV
jgi:hypothetical protein